MSAFTPAQRQHAVGLYKRALRAGRETFANDATVVQAWRQRVRTEFLAAKQQHTDANQIDAGLATWEDVIKVLRQNVVQGELNADTEAYKLRMRKDTEMGSNESIKKQREKQMDELRASKGSLQCGGGGVGAKTAGKVQQQQTGQQIRHASSSASVFAVAATESKKPSSSRLLEKFGGKEQKSLSAEEKEARKQAWTSTKHILPRPVPQFSQVAILADGSTIQLHTAAPRAVYKLTRDPTNHPVFNPRMERGRGTGDDDEDGRLARFLRKFSVEGETAEGTTATATAQEGDGDATAATAEGGEETAKPQASAQPMAAMFSEDDFDWMAEGAREEKHKLLTRGKGGAKKRR